MAEKGKITVFYHHPCLDGAVAAWAAYKKWGEDPNYDIKFIGIDHDTDEATKKLIFANIDTATHAVFADYCPKRSLMDEIADHAGKVTVYDHHDTPIQQMRGYCNPKVTMHFDENRSGGAIIHDELFGRQSRPKIISIAEDIDLERERNQEAYWISAYIDSLPYGNIEQIVSSVNRIMVMSREEMIALGRLAGQHHEEMLASTMDSAGWARLAILPDTDPVLVPMINANVRHLPREYSHRLRELAGSMHAPVALSWHVDRGSMVVVSVRTNGIPNAAEVAQYMGSAELGHGLGGGGNKTAAVARFTPNQFHARFKQVSPEEALAELKANGIVIERPTAERVTPRIPERGPK